MTGYLPAPCWPDRILVLGCPGAGKSAVARDLASATRLPVVHLDDEYWGAGWSRPPTEAWLALQRELVDRPQWIIDGNYLPSIHIRAAHAALVVIVDAPVLRCLVRVVRRAYRIRCGDHRPLPVQVRRQAQRGVRVAATRDLAALVRKVLAFRGASWWPTVEQARTNPRALLVVAVAGAGRSGQARLVAVRQRLDHRRVPALVLPLRDLIPFVRALRMSERQPVAGTAES